MAEETIFRVVVHKYRGASGLEGFSVDLEVHDGEDEDDATKAAITLLVRHLQNQTGLASWEAGIAEGRHQANPPSPGAPPRT